MEVRPGTTRIDPGATGRAIVGKVILPGGIVPGSWISGHCHLSPKIERVDVLTQEFRVRPDGSFRIEGVPPGTFKMVIFIHKKRFGRNVVGDIQLASGRARSSSPRNPGIHRSTSAPSDSRPRSREPAGRPRVIR